MHCEIRVVTVAGVTGASERTMTMTRTGQILMTLLTTACLATPAAAEEKPQPPRGARHPDSSQTSSSRPRYGFTAYGGFRALQIESLLFDSNEVDFGITDDDFRSGRFGFELDFALLPMVEILVGFDTGDAETAGNYLDLVYEDGSEIEHSAWLRMTEFSVGARVRPRPDGRANPYLVLGISRASYDYSETGEFVDFETSNIFYDEFKEAQVLTGFFAGVGLDYAVVRLPYGRRVDLFGEFRYARAQGQHRDGFNGFGDLTVARAGGLFGLRLRF